jgi:lipoate synthase
MRYAGELHLEHNGINIQAEYMQGQDKLFSTSRIPIYGGCGGIVGFDTKQPGTYTKSGLMVGLGETPEEVKLLLRDLYEHNVQVVTIGQYLQPSREHISVKEYVHPDVFEEYRRYGEELGFMFVESGPLVRSSYHAEKIQQYITK